MTQLRRFGLVPVIFLLFWLLLMIGGRSKLFRDPGTFWHTTVGEKILTDGFFDGDPFSFTYADARWVPHQWLGEIAMALLYRVGGFDSFLVVSAAILAALFTWLTILFLRSGWHFAPAILVVLLTLAVGSLQFHVRPLLLTMVFLTIVCYILKRFEIQSTSLISLIGLIPLFIIWTNTHGGVIAGFVVLAFCWAGWSIAAWLGWPSPFRSTRDSTKFFALTILCGLTAFANPYGWEIPRAWLHIMRGPKLSGLIEEHKPMNLADATSWPLIAFALLYFFVLAGLRERPRIAWLIPIMWLAQAFFRIRHGPLFALVGCIAILEMFPRTRWAMWLQSHRPDLYQPQKKTNDCSPWSWFVPGLLILVVLFLQARGVEAPIVGRGWAEFDQKRWPMELLPILKEFEPHADEPNHCFNSCNFGGFLIFHTPGYKVFIDDRVELYGEDYIEDYVHSDTDIRAESALEKWQAQYGQFHFALVEPDSAYAKLLRKQTDQWKLIQEAPAAVFFKRQQ